MGDDAADEAGRKHLLVYASGERLCVKVEWAGRCLGGRAVHRRLANSLLQRHTQMYISLTAPGLLLRRRLRGYLHHFCKSPWRRLAINIYATPWRESSRSARTGRVGPLDFAYDYEVSVPS